MQDLWCLLTGRPRPTAVLIEAETVPSDGLNRLLVPRPYSLSEAEESLLEGVASSHCDREVTLH